MPRCARLPLQHPAANRTSPEVPVCTIYIFCSPKKGANFRPTFIIFFFFLQEAELSRVKLTIGATVNFKLVWFVSWPAQWCVRGVTRACLASWSYAPRGTRGVCCCLIHMPSALGLGNNSVCQSPCSPGSAGSGTAPSLQLSPPLNRYTHT